MERVLKALNCANVLGLAMLRMPVVALNAVARLSLAAAIIYLCSILAGVMAGFALPTTAIFRWIDIARSAGLNEHYWAYMILSLCCLSAIAGWIARDACFDMINADEAALATFFQRWGFLIICSLFVFSISGSWAGLVRPGDLNIASIGGLLPFSDAHGYYASAQDQLKDGLWNTISARRPLAAAFRFIVAIGGGLSYSAMLLVQAVLASISVWVAARSLFRWRGPIAGFAFVAFSFMIFRSFLATSLTEPLGLIWAFLSTACFAEALRVRSLAFAILGFALTVLALMTRMGAMFLIPALMLWLLVSFGKGWREKLKLAAVAGAVVGGVYVLNTALQKSYGSGPDISGSNFAYVLCGLSIGHDWSECVRIYAAERKAAESDEKRFTDFLYARALQNIRSDPRPIVKRLVEGGVLFAASVPRTITDGYMRASESRWHAAFFVLTMAIGIGLSSRRNFQKIEVSFWMLSMSAILASSMFVFFDDGRRIMTASYPLIAMLLACGLMNPFKEKAVPQTIDRHLLRGSLAFVIFAVAAFLVVPALAHRFAPAPTSLASDPNEHEVFGGRRMSGFLVLSDDQPLPKSVAAIHYSDFAEIIALSGIEIYQGLLYPRAPDVPFGFIVAPRREKGADSHNLYIVPPEVVLQTKVSAWKFSTASWNPIGNNTVYWRLVTRAVPDTSPSR